MNTVEPITLKSIPATQAKQGASKHQVKGSQGKEGFAFGSYNYDITEEKKH